MSLKISWQQEAVDLLRGYYCELYHEVTLRETQRRYNMARRVERKMHAVGMVLEKAEAEGWKSRL